MIFPLRRERIFAWLFPALAAVAVWLVVIDWPDPITDYIDGSWQVALVDAHEHGRAFGNEIIFTAGPLGFLSAHFYAPDSLGLKLLWELAGKLLLAGVLVALTAPLVRAGRIAFLIVAALVVPWFPDTFLTLVLVLLVCQWLLPESPRLGQALASVVLLSFLAQFKFTYFLLAGAGVLCATFARAIRRDWRGVVAIAGGFGIAFVLWWLIAGQNPVRLGDYLRYSWQISAGYPWAMSSDESWPVFGIGAGLALLSGAAIARLWWTMPGPRLAALPLPAFLAAAWFLTWKHGFTRADGHVMGFFLFALCLGLLLATNAQVTNRRWFAAVGLLALVGCGFGEPRFYPDLIGNTLNHWRASAWGLAHLPTVRANFAASLARERRDHDRPRWRELVGRDSVDLLNFEQGLLLLNGLNYHPRPIPQSYSVYTGPLLQKNAGFFRRPGAPDFLVVRLGSIDDRFAMQDDSLVLAELPLRYEIAADDGNGLLLRKKNSPLGNRELQREPAREELFMLGRDLAVPDAAGHAQWLQAQFKLSWLGRLRSFFYKPPQLWMVATDNHGNVTRQRIVPPIAETGFVLQPLVQTPEEFGRFIRGKSVATVQSIRFEPASASEAEFWDAGHVIFSTLPELPMEFIDPMQAVVDTGIANLAPAAVHSNSAVEYIRLSDGRRALLVHVTGEVTFAPPPDRRHVQVEFGLREGAYRDGGQTDGADFVGEAEFADGRKSVLWQRHLDPLREPADRGPQRATIALPPEVTRLHLRTLPGPAGDGSWDWTYWAEMKFSP